MVIGDGWFWLVGLVEWNFLVTRIRDSVCAVFYHRLVHGCGQNQYLVG